MRHEALLGNLAFYLVKREIQRNICPEFPGAWRLMSPRPGLSGASPAFQQGGGPQGFCWGKGSAWRGSDTRLAFLRNKLPESWGRFHRPDSWVGASDFLSTGGRPVRCAGAMEKGLLGSQPWSASVGEQRGKGMQHELSSCYELCFVLMFVIPSRPHRTQR